MDVRHSVWCCLLAATISLCGCSITPDPSVDLLEGELRWMEDQLYMMEDQLEQRCRELSACRQAKSGTDGNCSPSGIPTPAQRVKPRVESSLPAPVREPDQNRSVPELIGPPHEPTPADSPATLPPRIFEEDTEPANDATDPDLDLDNFPEDLLEAPEIQLPVPEPNPPSTRPEIETPNGNSADSAAPLFLREDVEQLHLSAARVSARGAGEDQEKLLIVVEPQSKDSTYIELSAPVKVEIEDANQQGAQARLRTWDFDAVETSRTLRTSNMGQGIHLALDWPRDVPLVDDLRIVVAYRRLDGKEIRADKILQSEVPATSVAGWIPVARSRDASTAVEASATERGVADPFQLAAGSNPVKAPAVFETVPIPVSVADNEVNSSVSWTKPIPQSNGNKLAPIADVALESIEARVFGDVARNETQKPSRQPSRQAVALRTVPIVEEVPPEEVPAEEVSVEEVEVPSGPAWTPYR